VPCLKPLRRSAQLRCVSARSAASSERVNKEAVLRQKGNSRQDAIRKESHIFTTLKKGGQECRRICTAERVIATHNDSARLRYFRKVSRCDLRT
jgi:hypothetical protein